MKTLKCPALLFCVLLAACFDDNTTVDTVRISEIVIDTLKLQKEYNIEQNEALIIRAKDVISQTEKELPLSYEWQMNHQFFSDSSVFYYTSNALGSNDVRLKASNAHGSSFYHFKVKVNSAYEKGIAILSEDPSGMPRLSIMRELNDKEIENGAKQKFTTNGLTANNPELTFPKHPTDLAQRGKQLYISFTGTPSIYMLNSQVLNVESIVTDSDPDFVPTRLLIPDAPDKSAPVLTPSHKVYKLASVEGIILPYTQISASPMGIAFSGNQNQHIFWDKQGPAIVDIIGGYKTYSTEQEHIDFNGHTAIAIYSRDQTYFTAITRKESTYMQTTINKEWMKIINWDTYEQAFDILERQEPIEGQSPLLPETPYVSCPKYQCLFYAEGNKLYRYYYNSHRFPKASWKVLDDLPGCEITALAVSPDESQLYVGVYQPEETGLNGSCYILNSDTGAYEADTPYQNVAYKPVKIIYKKR